MQKANNILAHTECLSEEMLMKYVSEKLTPAQKHEVEKHLTDCDMCSDAAEGLAMIADKNRIGQITSELNKKIMGRVGVKKETKVIFLQQYRTQLAVAASVVVLPGLVWFFRSNMSMKELSPESSEKIFADKFEPYPAASEEKATEAVQIVESPGVERSITASASELKEERKGDQREGENHEAHSGL